MKVYLVNTSLTAGGVLPDIMRAVTEGGSPRGINEGAMKVYLAGGVQGNLRAFWRRMMHTGDYGKAMEAFLKNADDNEGLSMRGHQRDLHGREIPAGLARPMDEGRQGRGGGEMADGQDDG